MLFPFVQKKGLKMFNLFLKLFSAVKVPISILGAEIDQMSPPELVKQFEEALTAKSEVRNYCHQNYNT